MEDNHSPKLVFEPDNDIDDYTMVTAYINEEYARIKAEELGKSLTTQSTTQTTQSAEVLGLHSYHE